MTHVSTTPLPSSPIGPQGHRDAAESPLWQQGIALEQGCSDFLRRARSHLPARDWERLAESVWPLRRQIRDAFRLDQRTAILGRLETARATVADLQISLNALAQESDLQRFADQLTCLAAIADACARQLKGWAELLAPAAGLSSASPVPSASEAEARWNNAFALLVQLESPRPERAPVELVRPA